MGVVWREKGVCMVWVHSSYRSEVENFLPLARRHKERSPSVVEEAATLEARHAADRVASLGHGADEGDEFDRDVGQQVGGGKLVRLQGEKVGPQIDGLALDT